MRKPIILAVAAVCVASLPGSTLQRLSLNDMILKSTAIVRGSVLPVTSAAFRGSLIYTHYQLSVSAVYKGSQTAGQTIDVAVPGGALNGMRQPVAGSPMLAPGQDSVFYLWTSKTGLTQIIGLSQGLFAVTTNAQGVAVVTRGASTSPMVNSVGQAVTDSVFQMPLSQMISQIQSVLAGGGSQ
jgi:hypothetical protein